IVAVMGGVHEPCAHLGIAQQSLLLCERLRADLAPFGKTVERQRRLEGWKDRDAAAVALADDAPAGRRGRIEQRKLRFPGVARSLRQNAEGDHRAGLDREPAQTFKELHARRRIVAASGWLLRELEDSAALSDCRDEACDFGPGGEPRGDGLV